MHINLLCACWHHEAMRGLSSLASCCLLTSSLFPCLGSTDAPCSRLGDPAPPSPIWLPHSQGPHTLPYRDPEQVLYRNLEVDLDVQSQQSSYKHHKKLSQCHMVKLLFMALAIKVQPANFPLAHLGGRDTSFYPLSC
jgi:hypothetical protein